MFTPAQEVGPVCLHWSVTLEATTAVGSNYGHGRLIPRRRFLKQVLGAR